MAAAPPLWFEREMRELRVFMARCSELFVLDDELVASIDNEEANGTIDALKELGLFRPPYQCFCVDLNLRAYLGRHENKQNSEWLANGVERVRGYFDWDENRDPKRIMSLVALCPDGSIMPLLLEPAGPGLPPELPEDFLIWISSVLIVVLAVRNVVKVSRSTCGNVSRKSHTKQFPSYTTLILPGSAQREADPSNPPTGRTVSPHMRRGYVRDQHHGPKNSLVKSVFIDPVFVNADPNFVRQRERYFVRSPSVAPDDLPPQA